MREMQSGNLTNQNAPTIVAIFGATGDLAQRKLIPALFHLFVAGYLPEAFQIVGISRRDIGDSGYRDLARAALASVAQGKEVELEKFLTHLTYLAADFTAALSYQTLSDRLIEVEAGMGQCANKLFYLAVPPMSYGTIFRELADSGLTIPCSDETGWTRVLVEKPFGNDNETAQKLDALLGLLFKEDQIFRIDHYLAKEALQDILLFRFANALFEPVWNSEYIDHVEIKLHETTTVSGRGKFYDGVGALRDVGQNHVLQMVALVAMENPGVLTAERIREARASLLSHVVPLSTKDVVRGQYEGYRAEDGVAPDSMTETYFRIKLSLPSERWRGVPFYLESGKALAESKTEIVVHFKPPKDCLCDMPGHDHGNVITFRIQPNEGITVLFWAKRGGFAPGLEQKRLSFSYRDGSELATRIPDAYERVLYDAVMGDQILFTSTDEVAAAWKIITPILELWKNEPLLRYEKGSTGPRITR